MSAWTYEPRHGNVYEGEKMVAMVMNAKGGVGVEDTTHPAGRCLAASKDMYALLAQLAEAPDARSFDKLRAQAVALTMQVRGQ